jgi:protein glucosyltransferase
MLAVLQSAVEAHGADLARRLRRRELRLVFVTEDFGMVWRGAASKLPAFALCTDDQHVDIPVPDFTFGCYPETRYRNSSWPAVASLLEHKGGMLAWADRHPAIVHRSNWGVGPRRGLMPLLQGLRRNDSDAAALGAQVDVADTGFIGENKENFVWMDAQVSGRRDAARHKLCIK